MNKLKYFLLIAFAGVCAKDALAQDSKILTGEYIKANCDIKENHSKHDTIVAFGDPHCSYRETDDLKDGCWLVYDWSDSTRLIDRFTLVNGKLELQREWTAMDGERFVVSFKNGNKHGAMLRYNPLGQITLMMNYKDGEISGDYYYYDYDLDNGKLFKVLHFNQKEKLLDKQEFDTGVYDKFKLENK